MVLEGLTISRTVRIGWRYVAIGTAISLLLTVELLSSSRRSVVFPSTFPLEIPIFAVLASTAGLMTFVSDRTRGVYEYLMAYGIGPRTFYINELLATAAMASIILLVTLAVGIGGALSEGLSLGWSFEEPLLLYTLPMSFAGAFFTSTAGMIWSSLSTPRMGLNSPVGIAPTLGVAPTILVLLLAETAPSSEYYWITGGASVAILIAAFGLIAMSARLLGRERFLSQI